MSTQASASLDHDTQTRDVSRGANEVASERQDTVSARTDSPSLSTSATRSLDAGPRSGHHPRDESPFHAELTDIDLAAVLQAWETATTRLKCTHEALGEEVRRLTDELEVKNQQLARKNRLADLGQIASHVAHEVRNNLVPMTLYLSLLRRRLANDQDSLRVMDKIESGFTALQATVSDLLQFTVDPHPQRSRFRVNELVGEVCEALQPQMAAQQVRLDVDIPPAQEIHADREMLRRVLLNLLLNALDAMQDGGDLRISSGGMEVVELEIADSGPGISPEIEHQLFEPFFTTKSEGTGLGLAIVYQIVRAHDGQIHYRPGMQGGAAFVLSLPQATGS